MKGSHVGAREIEKLDLGGLVILVWINRDRV